MDDEIGALDKHFLEIEKRIPFNKPLSGFLIVERDNYYLVIKYVCIKVRTLEEAEKRISSENLLEAG